MRKGTRKIGKRKKRKIKRLQILFTNWLSKNCIPVEQGKPRGYTKARLWVFYEEELDGSLGLFNEVPDHLIRIDRIVRQPQGHLLLLRVSGAGKTTLSRFVTWGDDRTVFQIRVHNKYSGEDVDEDLRQVGCRSGCKDEKTGFSLNESNVRGSGCLERMNTVLADGEGKEGAPKKAEVMEDLERGEQAVIDAQNGMKSSKKQHLGEGRSMTHSPPLIKMDMESACILRGESSPIDWKGIRDVTRTEKFVPSIIDFNTDGITDDLGKIVVRDYLSNPEYTYDRIYWDNRACGPAAKWEIAQLEYAKRLTRDDPIRQELRAMEEAAVIKKNQVSRTNKQISTLEAFTNRYEEEEKAKRLGKLRAEKWSPWKSLQTGDVHREGVGKTKARKSPQIGDVRGSCREDRDG